MSPCIRQDVRSAQQSNDLRADGTRVLSRWVLTGSNNAVLGTEPNGKPIAMTRHRRVDLAT